MIGFLYQMAVAAVGVILVVATLWACGWNVKIERR